MVEDVYPRRRRAQLVEESVALVPELPPLDAAELLVEVGWYYGDHGEPERAHDLLHRAIAIYEEAPASGGHVQALFTLEMAEAAATSFREAAAVVARAIEVSAQLEDREWHRTMLIKQAWYDARAGDAELALSRAREASEMVVDGPDPMGEARLAANYTDLLLRTACDVEMVQAVGQRGLDVAEAWDLDTISVRYTRFNMSWALRRSGQVRRAARLIEPLTGEPPTEDRWLLHLERAVLDVVQGRAEAATALADRLSMFSVPMLDERLEVEQVRAEVAIWAGRPETVLELVLPSVEEAAQTESARDVGPLLTLAARAAADRGPSAAMFDRLTGLHEACTEDPLADRPVPADSLALAATWRAELARLTNEQTLQVWVAAASEWDRIRRPHDAAYCRWRGAQVALRDGQGTAAVAVAQACVPGLPRARAPRRGDRRDRSHRSGARTPILRCVVHLTMV